MSITAEVRQRRLRDRLASDMGALRVLFSEAGQIPMRPPVAAIAHDIMDRFAIRDPADVAALLDLLAQAQPAGTHQVADFAILSRILTRHRRDENKLAHQALLQRQQRLRTVPPAATTSAASAAARPAALLPKHLPTAAHPGATAAGVAAAVSAVGPGAAAMPFPGAGGAEASVRQWAAYLRSCAGNPAAQNMTFAQFSHAVSAAALPSNIGRIDPWHARQHFLACCNGSPAGLHTVTAPIDRLAFVAQATIPFSTAVTSRTSTGAKLALSWSNEAGRAGPSFLPHGALVPRPPPGDNAADLAPSVPHHHGTGSSPRRPATARPAVTRSQRLRTDAIAAAKQHEQFARASVELGVPIPLLRLKSDAVRAGESGAAAAAAAVPANASAPRPPRPRPATAR